uniref:Ycf20 n=1 Tax=Anunuuluaehu liula TaxID=3049639 RepID=UPI003001E87E
MRSRMTIIVLLKNIFNYKVKSLRCKLISLLLGFFIATVLSTMPAQTGDWGIIAASMIVTFNEIISKLVYNAKKNELTVIIIMNNIKIGIVYGLFVDAFKLGS